MASGVYIPPSDPGRVQPWWREGLSISCLKSPAQGGGVLFVCFCFFKLHRDSDSLVRTQFDFLLTPCSLPFPQFHGVFSEN